MPESIRRELPRLRQQHPHAHPYTLSLLIEAAGLGRFTVAQVRQWLALLDPPASAA
jgi:hypothetical protein